MKNKKVIRPCIILVLLCLLFNSSTLTAAVAKKVFTLKDKSITIYAKNTKIIRIAKNTTGSKPTYSSSDTSVAIVSSKGVVTGVKEGSAIITVKAGVKIANCKVTVKEWDIEVTNLSFDNEEIILGLKETGKSNLSYEPAYSNGKSITYTTSDPSVASVDGTTGVVTGLKEGTATITASTPKGISDSYLVYVTAYAYDELPAKTVVIEKNSTLAVTQGSVNLGDTVESLKKQFGTPARIDDNEYGCQTYVYNSIYTSLVFVYVRNNKVVGYYTNASEFSCAGVSNSMTQQEVEALTGNSSTWTLPDRYTIKVWYDTLGSGQSAAVFLTDTSIDHLWGAYSNLLANDRNLANSMERECLDLINSFRVRNSVPPVDLSALASASARSHCDDMIANNYASQISISGMTPSQRLSNSGVSFKEMKEVLIACRPAGIVYDFSGFMDTEIQRNAVLGGAAKYVGLGISYGNGISSRSSYIVADFYY